MYCSIFQKASKFDSEPDQFSSNFSNEVDPFIKYTFIVQDIDEYEPVIISDLKLPVYKSTELYDTIGHVRLSDRDKNAKFTFQVNSDFIDIRKEAF